MKLVVLIALACAFLGGCEDDENPANPGTTIMLFTGTVNGGTGNLSGSVDFAINGTTVTGLFTVTAPAAASHALTGTYNTSTKAITATGGGYTFSGVYDGANRLEGTVAGTGSGTFVVVRDDASAAVAFCGTFSGTDSGVWNFTVDGTSVIGSYTTNSGTTGALDGTISGNTITINNPGGGSPLATGTRTGDNASGTWNDGGGGSGTWTGTRCN